MTTLPSLEKQFIEIVNTWAAEYLNRTISDGYKTFAHSIGLNIKGPLNRTGKNLIEKRLEGQLLFMKYFATTRMMSNTTKSNLVKITRFLAGQNYWSRSKRPKYWLLFTLYNGSRVVLYTSDYEDIDFADHHSGSGFYGISISHASWEEVPPMFPAEFLARLRWDLEYDGFEVEFSVDEDNDDYINEDTPDTFEVLCRIDGDLEIDKSAKIMKCNTLFKVDLIKWVFSKQPGGPKLVFKDDD